MPSTFIEQNIRENSEETNRNKHKDVFKRIFCNRMYQAIIFFVIFSIVTPTLIYFWMNDLQKLKTDDGYYCALKNEYKVKCGVVNISYTDCIKINCCYDHEEFDCYHSAPSRYGYLVLSNDTETYEAQQETSPFGRPIEKTIKLSIVEVNEDNVDIILHNTNFISKENLNKNNYAVNKNIKNLGVDIYRTNGGRILTTSRGPLIISKTYWEWTIQITDDYLFGLGDLLLNSTEPITKIIYKNEEDHTTIASFLAHHKGSYHGLVIEHQGPLEVTVLPSKLIILKCLAGDFIRLKLFTGPSPHDIFRQQKILKTNKLPRWIFGTHICRNMDVSSLSDIIKSFTALNYNSDCIHENLMMFYLLEKDPQVIINLKGTIQKFKPQMKFQFPLMPMLPIGDYTIFEKAETLEVLYMEENRIWKGSYSNHPVAYIDFSSSNIIDFMKFLIQHFEALGTDSFILLNNWPQEDSFIFKNQDNYFQYINENLNKSMSHSIPWYLNDSKLKMHLITHNDYTKVQTTILKAVTQKPIITSSYQYGMENPSIAQNPKLTWNGFKSSLSSILYHSTQINPFVSSTTCGAKSDPSFSSEDICTRWYLTSVTLPILFTTRDWPKVYTESNSKLVQKALISREIFGYYYYNYLGKGEPLVRPMLFDYFQDVETFGIKNQYTLGNSLLVYQPILPKLSAIEIYFPEVEDGWFEFWGGNHYNKSGWNKFHIVPSDWIMFMKAGTAMPLIDVQDKDKNINIQVALNCLGLGGVCKANGELMFENSFLTFQIIDNILKLANLEKVQTDIDCSPTNNKYPFIISEITMYSSKDLPKQIPVNVNLCEQKGDQVDIQL